MTDQKTATLKLKKLVTSIVSHPYDTPRFNKTKKELEMKEGFSLQTVLIAICRHRGVKFSPKVDEGRMIIGKIKMPNLYKEKGTIDTEEIIVDLFSPIEDQPSLVNQLLLLLTTQKND